MAPTTITEPFRNSCVYVYTANRDKPMSTIEIDRERFVVDNERKDIMF